MCCGLWIYVHCALICDHTVLSVSILRWIIHLYIYITITITTILWVLCDNCTRTCFLIITFTIKLIWTHCLYASHFKSHLNSHLVWHCALTLVPIAYLPLYLSLSLSLSLALWIKLLYYIKVYEVCQSECNQHTMNVRQSSVKNVLRFCTLKWTKNGKWGDGGSHS